MRGHEAAAIKVELSPIVKSVHFRNSSLLPHMHTIAPSFTIGNENRIDIIYDGPRQHSSS